MELKSVVEELRYHGIQAARTNKGLSFGTIEECRAMFQQAFMVADPRITNYQHLPEYDQIIEWMSDSKGKGLLLAGNCGRGKSVILMGVLPILMNRKFNKILTTYHADQIPVQVDQIKRKWAIAIDEVGVEPKVNNYGERSEGFNTIMNEAERRAALLFLSTNLNAQQITDRYGVRTTDRMLGLCRVVRFAGPSLRSETLKDSFNQPKENDNKTTQNH